MRRETGVRALRSLVEDFLRDLLYELPERKDVARYIVSGDAYRGDEEITTILMIGGERVGREGVRLR